MFFCGASELRCPECVMSRCVGFCGFCCVIVQCIALISFVSWTTTFIWMTHLLFRVWISSSLFSAFNIAQEMPRYQLNTSLIRLVCSDMIANSWKFKTLLRLNIGEWEMIANKIFARNQDRFKQLCWDKNRKTVVGLIYTDSITSLWRPLAGE